MLLTTIVEDTRIQRGRVELQSNRNHPYPSVQPTKEDSQVRPYQKHSLGHDRHSLQPLQLLMMAVQSRLYLQKICRVEAQTWIGSVVQGDVGTLNANAGLSG